MARRGASGQTQGRGVAGEEEEAGTALSSLEMTTRSVQTRRLLDRHLLRALHTLPESSSQPPEPPCPQRVPPAVQKAAEPPGHAGPDLRGPEAVPGLPGSSVCATPV